MVTSYLLKALPRDKRNEKIQSDVGNLSCNPSFLSDKKYKKFFDKKLLRNVGCFSKHF